MGRNGVVVREDERVISHGVTVLLDHPDCRIERICGVMVLASTSLGDLFHRGALIKALFELRISKVHLGSEEKLGVLSEPELVVIPTDRFEKASLDAKCPCKGRATWIIELGRD